MSYRNRFSAAPHRAHLLTRGVSPLVLLGLLTFAACDAETTPVEPRAFTPEPSMAKGGGGGGGGGTPAPTGRLYFTSDIQAPGNLDIYAVNPDGTGLVRLTTAAGDDQVARAATTTGRVAFLSDRNAERWIYTMNSDGSNQQPIYAPDNGTLQSIALSADGSRLAFVATIAWQTDLWIIGVDGTGLTRLTNDAIVEREPAWSPNGRDIAYAATVNGTDDIYTISASRKTVTKLTNGAGANVSPSYSPDGRDIVFSSSRDGNYELYTMRNSGTNQTRILQTAGWHEVAPVYSPDGRYVAYLSYIATGGIPGMRYIGIGSTGQTGPVSGGPTILSVSWGM